MSDISIDNDCTYTRKGTKVAKLDLYYRDRSKLEDQLLQFDLFFKFKDDYVDDDDKVSLVATYMRGTAAKQIKPYLIKYIDSDNNDTNITKMFEEYNEFKECI